jgi:hypothetical protein
MYLSKCYKKILKEGRCRVPHSARRLPHELLFNGSSSLREHSPLIFVGLSPEQPDLQQVLVVAVRQRTDSVAEYNVTKTPGKQRKGTAYSLLQPLPLLVSTSVGRRAEPVDCASASSVWRLLMLAQPADAAATAAAAVEGSARRIAS